MKAPILTDTTALTRNRARALALPAPALFLQEDMRHEVQERLAEVNRSFKKVAIVTGFPDLWRESFPDALIVADTDVLALEPGAGPVCLQRRGPQQ